MTYIDQHKKNFQAAMEHLKKELTTLRTGRANPAIVEDILVLAYGSKQPLKAVASISVLDAKTIAVEPWDKSIVKEIESAISKSDIGISPVNNGSVIRLPLPELTADRRQDLIKVVHQKLENARISIRKVREEVRKDIENAMDENKITEDEKFKFQDMLEDLVKEYNAEIKTLGEEKETDIRKI